MSRSSSVFKTLIVEAFVFGWVLLLAGLIVLQNTGVLSVQATRVFTLLLVVIGLGAPFVLIAGFLYKRSKADRLVIVDGCCPKCRYDLRGQPDWATAKPGGLIQCPECGEMAKMPETAIHTPATPSQPPN